MTTLEDIASRLGQELVERIVVICEGEGASLLLLPSPMWRPVYLVTLLGDRLCRVQGGADGPTLARMTDDPATIVAALAGFVRGQAIARDEALHHLTVATAPHDGEVPWRRPPLPVDNDHLRQADLATSKALATALLAIDGYLGGTPSDGLTYAARDALEVMVATAYPDAMPWPVSGELKGTVDAARAARTP